jgi:hypothetical protein
MRKSNRDYSKPKKPEPVRYGVKVRFYSDSFFGQESKSVVAGGGYPQNTDIATATAEAAKWRAHFAVNSTRADVFIEVSPPLSQRNTVGRQAAVRHDAA